MIEQLETRLIKSAPHFRAIWLLPTHLNFSLSDQAIVEKLRPIYAPDSPFYEDIVEHKDFEVIEKEMEHWVAFWRQVSAEEKPKRVLDCLNYKSGFNIDLYPNVNVIFLHFLSLPVTTCSVERSFSEMRLLKTWLCSTMTDNCLSSLALMHFNYEVDIPYELLMQKWSSSKNRLISLTISDWYDEESTA